MSFVSSSASLEKTRLVNNLIRIAKEELRKGNKSITQEKIDQLKQYSNYMGKNSAAHSFEFFRAKRQQNTLSSSVSESDISDTNTLIVNEDHDGEHINEIYSPLYKKFSLAEYKSSHPYHKKSNEGPFSSFSSTPSNEGSLSETFSKLENNIINSLEVLTSFLDNIHLITRFKTINNWKINYALKQTNKLWLLMLVFILRKIISKLIHKTRKLSLLQKEFSEASKDLDNTNQFDNLIIEKFENSIDTLQADVKVLYFELFGNVIDMAFVLVDLLNLVIPTWMSSMLNVVSGIMSLYRINKSSADVDG